MTNKQMIASLVKDFKNQGKHLTYLKTKIRNFVKDGFELDTKYFKGRNLAHYAVRYNVVGIIPFMKYLGLNIDLCDDNFDAPIHMAVRSNKLTMAKDIIKAGADINIGCEFEQTALHIAVSEDYPEMLELLLVSGADPSLVDEHNLTPLDYALQDKNEEIIKILKTKRRGKKHG